MTLGHICCVYCLSVDTRGHLHLQPEALVLHSVVENTYLPVQIHCGFTVSLCILLLLKFLFLLCDFGDSLAYKLEVLF